MVFIVTFAIPIYFSLLTLYEQEIPLYSNLYGNILNYRQKKLQNVGSKQKNNVGGSGRSGSIHRKMGSQCFGSRSLFRLKKQGKESWERKMGWDKGCHVIDGYG